MNPCIPTYNDNQEGVNEVLCNSLEQELCKRLPGAESKMWHSAPVWFINGSMITGYTVLKDRVRRRYISFDQLDNNLIQ